MIKAVIFDLDGTLVQTEKLKALSYAKAAVELCPETIEEQDVVEAFKEVVGLSRREVATWLMDRFELEPKASARIDEFGVNAPWQAYVQLRLSIYEKMLEDPQLLLENQWPHAIELLKAVKAKGCKLGLATMSYCEQARKVLGILDLANEFDFVATRDDVENGKPDPEIYHLVLTELQESAADSIVIEDSPAGVEAALNAGTDVIAIATPFTLKRLQQMENLPKDRLVTSPELIMDVVTRVFKEHQI